LIRTDSCFKTQGKWLIEKPGGGYVCANAFEAETTCCQHRAVELSLSL